MKKEILSMSYYHFLIVFLIAGLGILLGSFFDYDASTFIVHQGTFLGKAIEGFGVFFGCLMIVLGSTMLFKSLIRYRLVLIKILGFILLFAGLVISSYIAASFIKDSKPTNVIYGLSFSSMYSYIIAGSINLVLVILALIIIKSEDKEYLLRAGLAIILTMILQYAIIHFIKVFACRPRFRFLVDTDLNVTDETFRAWWEFNPFAFKDDSHKSWPSGHTGTASVCLLLPLIAPVLRHPFKHARGFLFTLGLVFIFFVAFMRVFHGAHFISDVSFGLLITLLISLLMVLLFDKLFRKRKSILTQNLS